MNILRTIVSLLSYEILTLDEPESFNRHRGTKSIEFDEVSDISRWATVVYCKDARLVW